MAITCKAGDLGYGEVVLDRQKEDLTGVERENWERGGQPQKESGNGNEGHGG